MTAQARQNDEQIPSLATSPREIKPITAQHYRRVFQIIKDHSVKKRSIDIYEPANVSPKQIVEDFYEYAGTLKEGSFNTYRAALLWELRNHRGNQYFDEALQLMEILDFDWQKQKEVKKQIFGSETKRKVQVITDEDLELLTEYLTERSHRSKWAMATNLWVRSGLAAGLRPGEWQSAKWHESSTDEKPILTALTSKEKIDAPAFKKKAHLDDLDSLRESEEEAENDRDSKRWRLVEIDPAYKLDIDLHMESIKREVDEGASFNTYYENCRKTLTRACQEIWGGKKFYNLYTMRKTFSANAKAMHGVEKTAEMMGHSRPDTPSAASYGKANQAMKGRVKGHVRPTKKKADWQQTNEAGETAAMNEDQ